MIRCGRLHRFEPPSLLARDGVPASKPLRSSALVRAVVKRARRRRRWEHALVNLWCASIWFLLFAVAWWAQRHEPDPDPTLRRNLGVPIASTGGT